MLNSTENSTKPNYYPNSSPKLKIHDLELHKPTPKDLGLHELKIENLGFIPTGKESSPRKEYRRTNDGRYHLASFFGIDPVILINAPCIWLTPMTVEDFVIFIAFEFSDYPLVIRIETETMTTLYGVHEINDEIKQFIEESNATLYINPAVQL